jgi:DNA (cytosine-5)-methyltransferase 1
MNFISICSGIEAASVAFGPLGWKAIAFSEIEPFPCAVLAHHYPDVPNFGDMTKFREWPEEIFANADAVVGGPPCQAFSVAGTRNGLNDDRGNLTLTYAELINHADAIRFIHGKPPVVVLYENVPGLLSDKTGAFGCFLAGLAGEDDPLEPPGGRWSDAGYVHGPQRSIAWRVLDAQYFGLAQRRRRVFVVASARAGFDPAEVLFEFDGVRRDSAPSREAWEETAGTLASRTTGGGFPGTDEACSGYLQPVIRMAHGQGGGDKPHVLAPVAFVQNSRDEVRLMGGDGQIVGGLAAEAGMKRQCYVLSPACYPLLEVGKRTGKSTTDPRAGLGIGGDQDPMYTLQAGAQHGVCVTGDITHTLKDEGLDGSEDGTGRGQPIVAFTTEQTPKHNNDCALTLTKQSPTGGGQIQSVMVGSAVRRLTPRECEFLQGFPRSYTAIPWRKKPAEDCPDGPRYKALGNSMAVPCMRWIGLRIERQMAGVSDG